MGIDLALLAALVAASTIGLAIALRLRKPKNAAMQHSIDNPGGHEWAD